ncbi:hypothetical protein MN608_10345 [Microdochium nivale]|nr:hypothetical protein MN608_10345 [Microdochium nivale]
MAPVDADFRAGERSHLLASFARLRPARRVEMHKPLAWMNANCRCHVRIREQSNWYSTKRVVRRTRSGKVGLTRVGSVGASTRQSYFMSSVSVCGSDWTDVESHDFDIL